jgi:hypothetical protein
MSVETEVRRSMTPHELSEYIERFISGQRHSPHADHRWLADYLGEALRIVRQVRSDNLDAEYRNLVTAFRLVEIAKERDDKKREIDSLEKEIRRLETLKQMQASDHQSDDR